MGNAFQNVYIVGIPISDYQHFILRLETRMVVVYYLPVFKNLYIPIRYQKVLKNVNVMILNDNISVWFCWIVTSFFCIDNFFVCFIFNSQYDNTNGNG